MNQLTHELLNELILLREFKRKVTNNFTIADKSKGGKVSASKVNTCPNCSRVITGSGPFAYHLKKCNKSLDK